MPFHYQNPSPVDRGSQDSYIRAIAILEKRSWEDIYMDICREALDLSANPQEEYTVFKYIERRYPGSSISIYGVSTKVKDFAAAHPQGGYILRLGEGWATCLLDGDLYDTKNYINKPISKAWKLF